MPRLPLLLAGGRNAEELVLLDLEALGSLAVEGSDAEVTAVLTHLVAEVALAPWAEGVEVLAVGFADDLAQSLEELAPDRVTAVDDLDSSMLRVLVTRASRVAEAGDRLASRVQASGPDAQTEVRPPLLVVCATAPEELPDLVPDEGRAAVVVIAPAPWAISRTTWVLGGPLPVPGRAFAPVPCGLDAERAASLAESLRIARMPVVSESKPAALPAAADPSASELAPKLPAPEQLVISARPIASVANSCATKSDRCTDELDVAVAAYLDGTAPVSVGLLGPITVHATGNIDPDRRSRLTEIVAHLPAPRRGAAIADFHGAAWPAPPAPPDPRTPAHPRAPAPLRAPP
mgnify:CR=1 FL=1